MSLDCDVVISARSLDNARRSLEAGDADFAASRAYYAMFYADCGRALREALEERMVADYQAGEEFAPARDQKLLARAEAFVIGAQAFLDRPSS